MKVVQIQMNSQGDKAKNLVDAARLLDEASTEKPDIVVLPEYWALLGNSPDEFHASAETFPDGAAYALMKEKAAEHGYYVHGGSIVEKAGNAFYNTTVVFDRAGEEVTRYRKIHLFDVDVPGGARHRESETIARGEEIVTYEVDGRTVGCSICYDIRFPELFRALRDKGAEVIMLPAAFTMMTGKDHWELLARARAVETQTYFLATGQFGTHADGKKACYGHTMAINPWGHVIAQVGDQVGLSVSKLDFPYLETVRQNLPVANHHVL